MKTSANTWDLSEEHKWEWDPALSQSYQLSPDAPGFLSTASCLLGSVL